MACKPLKTFCIFFLALIYCAHPAYAQEKDNRWLDLLFGIGDAINDQIFKNDSSGKAEGKRLTTPEFLPKGWHSTFLLEPVFNSKILVVEAGDANRETVLMVHGLGQDGFQSWLKTAAALQKRYHVVMLDLPGFGYSALPAGRYSPANYAKVLKWLVKQKSAGKVHLVGHSMGAAVCLKFGAEYPQLVQTVVLADVAGILHRTAFIKHITEPFFPDQFIPFSVTGKTIESVLLNDTLTKYITRAPDPSKVLEKSDLLWNLATMNRPNVNAAFVLIETEFTKDIKKFDHPTTLIWGADDPVTPVRTARLLVHKLPNAQLKIIADAEHSPMITHPVEFNQLLTDALKSGNDIDKPKKPWNWPAWKSIDCENQNGETYTGNYRKIVLRNCEQVTLRDVQAHELIIENSLVYIENTDVSGSSTACTTKDSIVVATNLSCGGETGLIADNSRLDFAGAVITGSKSAGSIGSESYLVLSVSEIKSPAYTGTAHGAYRLSDTQLESSFVKQPAATKKDYKSSI